MRTISSFQDRKPSSDGKPIHSPQRKDEECFSAGSIYIYILLCP
jgi:hypothetical protein